MNAYVETEQVILDMLKVGVAKRLTDQMAVELRAYVCANKLASKRVALRVELPRSPWQARKLRVKCLPTIHTLGQLMVAAWTRLFPVKSYVREETHTFTVHDVYPDAELRLPPKELGKPYRLATYSPPAYYERATP